MEDTDDALPTIPLKCFTEVVNFQPSSTTQDDSTAPYGEQADIQPLRAHSQENKDTTREPRSLQHQEGEINILEPDEGENGLDIHEL